jgi:hypothetical protein
MTRDAIPPEPGRRTVTFASNGFNEGGYRQSSAVLDGTIRREAMDRYDNFSQ